MKLEQKAAMFMAYLPNGFSNEIMEGPQEDKSYSVYFNKVPSVNPFY